MYITFFSLSCDDKCPSEVQHVCGCDGKTYLNQCELEKQNCIDKTNIDIRHNGKCRSKQIIPLVSSLIP